MHDAGVSRSFLSRGSLLGLVVVAGCRIAADVRETPLHGPAPESIGVWPFVDAADAGDRDLLAGLDVALQRRGYRGPSREVGTALLFDATPAPSPSFADNEPAALGRRMDVDAILVLQVRRFVADDATGRLRSAAWDLRWRLWSTRGHGVLWSFDHAGSWQPPRGDEDPLRRLDAEPDIVMFGGDRSTNFRDVRDLTTWLHRHAMEHLPAGSR